MNAKMVVFALLTSSAVPELGRAAAESMLRADMLARLEAASHAPDSIRLSAMGTPSFAGLPFEEAKAFFRRKTAMTPPELDALEDRYKSKGFGIAGVHARQVLEEAHGALFDAIADGAAEKDTLARIRASFASAGVDSPTSFQLQTTFDNAVLGAYAGGRYAQLTHPDVARARPFWQYRTAGDNRVRPTHQAMNGRVFPSDSPVWQTWFPPNGHRCRCGVESLSRGELEARGLTAADDVPARIETEDGKHVHMIPDPGFSGSPATQVAADETVDGIRFEARRTGALSQGAGDLNRAADPTRRRRVEAFAGLSPHDVERQLERTPVFNVELARPPLAHGELEVDWHMYSQNLDTAEQLVTRLVQEKGLYRLKDRIAVSARATFFSGWDGAHWPDPEVVYDDALAHRMGLAAGATVASSTEYALRLRVHPGELEHALAFLEANGERGEGKSPVRRAWDIQDVRVRGGAGAHLPDGAKWKRAFRNVRATDGGREIVTLSRGPLPGFDRAEAIAVNASLWGVL